EAKGLESGGWALVTHKDKRLVAYPIGQINEDEDWFELELSGSSGAVSLLRSAFKLALQPREHDVNGRLAWSSASTEAVTLVELADPTLANELKLGQKLICAGDDFAALVELKDIQRKVGSTKLHLAPPFHQDTEATGLSRHACILYANVARATHGETQPEKILGSGDASQTQPSFDLPPEKISWVADPEFASGVRADLTLRVGQRVWQQVENLAHSGAEDHDYQVEVDEDGLLSVQFGDGRNGRRLPTGVDNVRVRYRTGYGEAGNLDANALVKIARPHRLIEDFVAPLASAGGAEKESAESMRESAPATVLALQRAVSLDDFTHLAAHHSMVWQARAFEKMPDRPARPLIEVVVVAAGGATFNPGSETALLIQNYLQEHSIPGTPVSVISYAPLLLDLKVSIMVDEAAFDKKQVAQAVQDQLATGLALKQRRLGQPLFRSEVIALLEQVEGVENGHCEILATPYVGLSVAERPRLHKADDGGIRRVSVKPHQLLYLDPDLHEPVVTTRQYEI
ncbi:MAG: putative baseplate assembly protein, partial [Gammaproteobacteria bacterium]|nr:putative baseplate assembly protein [Gammaproteobacteria bacterium]